MNSSPSASDPVKAVLVRMAVDAYPLLLLPAHRGEGMGQSLSLHGHPLGGEALSALSSDEPLSRLFRRDAPTGGASGSYVSSLGTGGTTPQAVQFAEQVIQAAWSMARMTWPCPSLDQLVDTTVANVDRLRQAMGKQAASVPVKLVLTGFKLPEGRSLTTPWGQLRAIEEWEREFTPEHLDHQVSGQFGEEPTTTVSFGGDVVLDTAVSLRIEVTDSPDAPSDDDWYEALRRLSPVPSLRWIVEALALGLLMVIDRPVQAWAVARLAWSWTGNPLERSTGLGWNDTRQGRSFMPYQMTESDADGLSRWLDLIEKHRDKLPEIATRRILSAASERHSASDRLVDAVIVWESLFSSNQEAGLRISAAIAWLLHEHVADFESRKTLQKEVNGIYGVRSKVVHGSVFDGHSKFRAADADRALELARDVLRCVIERRPDLLSLSSTDRSVSLLLGDKLGPVEP